MSRGILSGGFCPGGFVWGDFVLESFWRTIAAAFLGISKIPIANFEIHSFFLLVHKFLFSSDTNLFPEKLNLE